MTGRSGQQASNGATARSEQRKAAPPSGAPHHRPAKSDSTAAAKPPKQRESREDAVQRLTRQVEEAWGDDYAQKLDRRGVYLPRVVSKDFCEVLSRLARHTTLEAFASAAADIVSDNPFVQPGRGGKTSTRISPEGTRSLQLSDLKKVDDRRLMAAKKPANAPQPHHDSPSDGTRASKKRRHSVESPEIARSNGATELPSDGAESENEEGSTYLSNASTNYTFSGLLDDGAGGRSASDMTIGDHDLGRVGGVPNPHGPQKRGAARAQLRATSVPEAYGRRPEHFGRPQNSRALQPRDPNQLQHDRVPANGHGSKQSRRDPRQDMTSVEEQLKQTMDLLADALDGDLSTFRTDDKSYKDVMARQARLQATPAIPDQRSLVDYNAFKAYVEKLNKEVRQREAAKAETVKAVQAAEKGRAEGQAALRDWEDLLQRSVDALQTNLQAVKAALYGDEGEEEG